MSWYQRGLEANGLVSHSMNDMLKKMAMASVHKTIRVAKSPVVSLDWDCTANR